MSGSQANGQQLQTTALSTIVLMSASVAAVGLFSWGAPPWTSAAEIFIAILALNLLDVWLPHGDTVDVDIALAAASVVQLGPASALLVIAVARAVAHLLRYGLARGDHLLGVLARRSAGVITSGVCGWAMGVRFGDAWSPEAVLVVGVYALTVFVLAQLTLSLESGRTLIHVVQSSVAFQGSLLAAQVSLGALLLILYQDMGVWSVVVIVLLLLAMRQSFVLLLQVRNSYRLTFQALLRALYAEAPEDLERAHRVTQRAIEIGVAMGLYGSRLEHLEYAAMLSEASLSRRRSSSTQDGVRWDMTEHMSDVRFLQPVLPVLRLVGGRQEVALAAARDCLLAYAIACARANEDCEPLPVDRDALARRLTKSQQRRLAASGILDSC